MHESYRTETDGPVSCRGDGPGPGRLLWRQRKWGRHRHRVPYPRHHRRADILRRPDRGRHYRRAKYIEPNAPGMGPAEVQVSQQIFEGLVRTGDDGSIEPVLATDWTISDDGLTYTFNLVQGVKFSNGEDVEPSDWVWSFYRARDYETSNYRYIAEAIDTVEATDEQVVITLTEPNAAFLAELGCFNMVLGDQSYAESMSDEEYLKNPVGTGPYMLKDWTQGSSLTLEANPYYRVEGMPKTKEIKYVLIADDNTRLMQLQSGQIDVAPTFPFSLAQGVESNEALALDIFPSTQIYYLTVNTTKPPFDDVKVRRPCITR